MNYKNHVFKDTLGGTFKYMDEPDRLDTLLTKDSHRYNRPRLKQGDIDIGGHVEWYINHIRQGNLKTLVFFPLTKAMSLSNEFQLQVLKSLPIPCTYKNSQIKELHARRKLAVENGYTLTSYDNTVEVS